MPKTLLLADDSITIQKIVNLTFSGEGIDVVTVSNGDAAIRKVEELHPDVVLADIFMPGKNGYEVCEHIKNDSVLNSTPVILLVGAFEPFDPVEAERVRANGHLTKPFEIKVLISAVTSLMSFEDERTKGDSGIGFQAEGREDSAESEDLSPEIAPDSKEQPELIQPTSLQPEGLEVVEITSTTDLMPEHVEVEGAESERGNSESINDIRSNTTESNMSGLDKSNPPQASSMLEDLDPLGLLSDSAFDGDADSSNEARSLVVDIWESRPSANLTPNQRGPSELRESGAPTVTSSAATVDSEGHEFHDTPIDPIPRIEVERARSDQGELSLAPALEENSMDLNSDDLVERIAHRVVEKMTREVIEKIAWEVVPDLAELLIKEQIETHLKSRPL